MRCMEAGESVAADIRYPAGESGGAELAQGVLDARALYPECSLADLYDPLTMPSELVTAHRKLDVAVEKVYGRTFADDAERVAFLFEKYRELTEK